MIYSRSYLSPGIYSYFISLADRFEDDELLAYAEQQIAAEDEDSDDPLDAFMSGIEVQLETRGTPVP